MMHVRKALMGGGSGCDHTYETSLLSPSPSSLWMRKWFHLFALLVYLPGVALDPNFLSLAASLVTFLFVVAEVSHIKR